MDLYLGIPSGSGIDYSSFGWYDIAGYLQKWLSSCCVSVHGGAGYRPVHVRTIGKPHTMTPWDGLVYLVGDWGDSIIDRVGAVGTADTGLRAGRTAAFYHGGKTSEMISEVYVNAHSTYAIAATIFHELLHNKFRLLYDIHGTPGNFTSASAPFDTKGPNEFDRKLMCAALPLPAIQFQGGF